MDSDLRNFLESLPALGQEEIELIGRNLTVRKFEKGTFLLNQGDYSNDCFFVLKGCIRQFSIIDGEEKTTDFFTERQAITSISGYTEKQPSRYYLTCIEDSTLIVGDFEEEKEMYSKFPILASITRMMVEEEFGKTQENFAEFKTSSPEKRYLDLLKNRPELLNRVPLRDIASYLGMTPESLSRIRKRIFIKDG